MNRVRYFAMHHQPHPLEIKNDNRFLKWFAQRIPGLKPKAPQAPFATQMHIPESVLVAMTAMHHTNPQWLDDEEAFSAQLFTQKTSTADDDNVETDDNVADEDNVLAVLEKTFLEHNKEFDEWPPTPEQRKLFRKISRGIYVN